MAFGTFLASYMNHLIGESAATTEPESSRNNNNNNQRSHDARKRKFNDDPEEGGNEESSSSGRKKHKTRGNEPSINDEVEAYRNSPEWRRRQKKIKETQRIMTGREAIRTASKEERAREQEKLERVKVAMSAKIASEAKLRDNTMPIGQRSMHRKILRASNKVVRKEPCPMCDKKFRTRRDTNPIVFYRDCGHRFHHDCISFWMHDLDGGCPFCFH